MPKRPRPGLLAKFHRLYWRLLIKKLRKLSAKKAAVTRRQRRLAKSAVYHYKKGWDTE